MADVTFSITAGDSTTCALTLTNNGDADVQRNDVVEWILQDGATNIASIDSIEEDQGSNNLFTGEPARITGTNNFFGTISPSVGTGQVETYHINWKDTSGKACTFDPTLTVNT